MRLIFTFNLMLLFAIAAQAQWTKVEVGTTESFRGLSVVSEKVVWASGTGGTVVRTIDGGKKWDVIKVPGAEKLDFRDVEAFDVRTAYILSIGNGESSRIYKTTDGGKSWNEQFRNKDEKAFFDAIACWDRDSCVAMSDPVDGRFLLITTANGGDKWESWGTGRRTPIPPALPGEAAFAASGTCLITKPGFGLFLVSGGSTARVYSGSASPKQFSWAVADTAMAKGSAGAGIFSIAMLDRKNGVIVGGNYEKPTENIGNLAFTTDGGRSWKPQTGLTGYRSGVAYVDKKTIIAVGTSGTDISHNGGKAWTKAGSEELNAVASTGKRSVWAVGPRGGVYRWK